MTNLDVSLPDEEGIRDVTSNTTNVRKKKAASSQLALRLQIVLEILGSGEAGQCKAALASFTSFLHIRLDGCGVWPWRRAVNATDDRARNPLKPDGHAIANQCLFRPLSSVLQIEPPGQQ